MGVPCLVFLQVVTPSKEDQGLGDGVCSGFCKWPRVGLHFSALRQCVSIAIPQSFASVIQHLLCVGQVQALKEKEE